MRAESDRGEGANAAVKTEGGGDERWTSGDGGRGARRRDDDETRAGSGLGERDTAGCARGGVGGAKERTEDESAGDHDRWGAGVEVE
jgi:hypothetical protein